ncbi:MAG: glycosyltransferase family 2 protein [Phormidium sp. BM_Day4_Bin.17]|nr:glycosyltransferase family 2 protein [Phormidium sp. BM_Day4_Bin.17]
MFEAIRQAQPPKLLVIADGPRPERPGEADQCAAARSIIDRVDWDCEVLTNYSDRNLGCRHRVSSGLTWAFNTVEEAIVLEDDCLPHPSFFRFCQELLEKYRDEPRVMSISGNNFQFGQRRTPYSYYFSRYNHIWGWASWRRAWQHYDLSMQVWPRLRTSDWLKTKLGHPQIIQYWSRIFQMAYEGFDTWDYAWLFACWYQDGLIALPEVNLVSNIGFGELATHTKMNSRFSNIPAQQVNLPLFHPDKILVCNDADIHTERIMFSGVYNNFWLHNQNLSDISKPLVPHNTSSKTDCYRNIKLNPWQPEYYLQLGYIFSMAQEKDIAKRAYDKAREIQN